MSLSDLVKAATTNNSATQQQGVSQSVAPQAVDLSGANINTNGGDVNLSQVNNVKQEVELNQVNIKNDVTVNLMVDPEYVKSMITKIGMDISIETVDKIIKLLHLLANVNEGDNENASPLRKIINEVTTITSDGRIDITEIPAIIKILVQLLNVQLTKKFLSQIKADLTSQITDEDIAILIKLIVNMLVDNKLISIGNTDLAAINKLIDVSINLLTTSIKVAKVTVGKWCCCF